MNRDHGERLTEYVTIVVLLGATVVAFPEAVLLPDAVADASFDEPEDCACVWDWLADWDCDEVCDEFWAYATLAITTRRAKMAGWIRKVRILRYQAVRSGTVGV
jgi:hypothetical protein